MEDKKVRVNIYLDSDLKRRADDMAKRLGVSFSALCSLALYDYIKQDSVIDMSNFLRKLQGFEKSNGSSLD